MADPSYLSYTMADTSIPVIFTCASRSHNSCCRQQIKKTTICLFFLDSIYYMVVFSSYLLGSVILTTQNEAKIIENQGFLFLHIESDIISAENVILRYFRLKMPSQGRCFVRKLQKTEAMVSLYCNNKPKYYWKF
jgi:hypothetical protein